MENFTDVAVEVLLAGEGDAGEEDVLGGRQSPGVSSEDGQRGDPPGLGVTREHLGSSSVHCSGELGQNNHQS